MTERLRDDLLKVGELLAGRGLPAEVDEASLVCRAEVADADGDPVVSLQVALVALESDDDEESVSSSESAAVIDIRAVFVEPVPDDHQAEVVEFILRVNERVSIGSFGFDADLKLFSFRLGALFEAGALDDASAGANIDRVLGTLEDFFPYVVAVVLGETSGRSAAEDALS